MTISYLSGAYKNAGDFLIEKRVLEILRFVCKDAVIKKFLRNEVEDKYQEINDADAIVIAGGPLFRPNIEGILPLSICIEKFTKPMMVFGGGWRGGDGSVSLSNNYQFVPETAEFLKKIDDVGFGLGCRDIYTVRALKAQGYKNVVLTGCPAWYALDHVDSVELQNGCGMNYKKINISDPASPQNFSSAVSLAEHIVRKYPNPEVNYVFHRGINLEDENCRNYYNQLKAISRLNVTDISNGVDGFKIYDDCDLHIGFRVHAHIYNLSIRNKTILIEEDGRGAGVNEVLGLVSIKAYDDRIKNVYNISGGTIYNIEQRIRRLLRLRNNAVNVSSLNRINEHINSEVDIYLDLLERTDFQYLKNAFALQKLMFKDMCDFVSQLNTIVQGGGNVLIISRLQNCCQQRQSMLIPGCIYLLLLIHYKFLMDTIEQKAHGHRINSK